MKNSLIYKIPRPVVDVKPFSHGFDETYDDWLRQANPTPHLDMDQFFASWNDRFRAQFDAIDAQIACINQALGTSPARRTIC